MRKRDNAAMSEMEIAQQKEYKEAFEKLQWPSLATIFGTMFSVGGIIWFLNTKSILDYYQPILCTVVGLFLCIIGAINSVRGAIEKKQLQDFYYWKYVYSARKDDEQ